MHDTYATIGLSDKHRRYNPIKPRRKKHRAISYKLNLTFTNYNTKKTQDIKLSLLTEKLGNFTVFLRLVILRRR